ncbi:MAG TPA: hypothetical protein VFH95_14855 [Candidatus Kapabacteria bacterium]|nr:hypothetical protein [Candidatus Kapabacteria bacterium]
MNKPSTLRDKLRLLIDGQAPPRNTRELFAAALRSKDASGFRPLALLDSVRLDLALFVHRYFAATVFASLLLIGGGAWLAFSAIGSATPTVSATNQAFAAPVPSQQFSIAQIRWTGRVAQTLVCDPPTGSQTEVRATRAMAGSQTEVYATSVEPKEPARAVPSENFISVGIRPMRLHYVEPPLDYSGVTFSVQFEQSNIPADPAHPEFAATSTDDLNYQLGYRFDRFEEAGIGYSRHVYRRLSSTTTTIAVFNPATGQTTFVHHTIWHNSDDPISLPGLYYTFHANDFKYFGIEPFITAFASKPSAGFLWRASAGLEWNEWDNLNAVFTYSREQLNSATYTTPQNIHNIFNLGLSYRLLP